MFAVLGAGLTAAALGLAMFLAGIGVCYVIGAVVAAVGAAVLRSLGML
jgi:hypothetical protein